MKNSTYTSAFVIGCALFITIPCIGAAAELRAGDQPSVQSGTTIQDDLYIAGGNVTAAGAVTGDTNAAGGSVLITGTTRGDLQVVGGNVTVLGAVSDDVRIVGGNITINGAVASDVAVLGGQITIAGSGVGGDVVGAGGTIRIDAPVAGDVRIAGGDVIINAPIKGVVEIEADKVTLGPAARISGDLTYSAGKEATIEEGAVVSGEKKFTPREMTRENIEGVAKRSIFAFLSAWIIAKLLMSLVMAFAIFYLFKRYTETIVTDSLSEPLPQLGRGVVALIVWPVVSVIFLATIIGLPLGIIGLLGYAILIIFANFMAPLLLGSLLFSWATKRGYEVNWKTVTLGVLVYFILGYIPVVGWIIRFIFFLMVLGAILKLKWSLAKEWR